MKVVVVLACTYCVKFVILTCVPTGPEIVPLAVTVNCQVLLDPAGLRLVKRPEQVIESTVAEGCSGGVGAVTVNAAFAVLPALSVAIASYVPGFV